jgi:hypothetical protein
MQHRLTRFAMMHSGIGSPHTLQAYPTRSKTCSRGRGLVKVVWGVSEGFDRHDACGKRIACRAEERQNCFEKRMGL